MTTPGSGPRCTALERRLLWWLLAIFLVCSHGYVDNPDAEVEFQTARAIYLRGSAALSDKHQDASSAEAGIVTHRPEPGNERVGLNVARGVDGKFYSWFGIGHALVMVPFYAIGDGLAKLAPGIDRAALETRIESLGPSFGPAFGEEFLAHLVVSLHSPLAALGICWLLLRILAGLGFALRARVVAVAVAALSTQLLPGSRESMSDVSAGFFLIWALERLLRWGRSGGYSHDGLEHGAPRRWRDLLFAGVLAGFAMLCRPNHAVPVFLFGVYVLFVAWRDREQGSTLAAGLVPPLRAGMAFVIGAMPFLAAMLAFNYARFHDVFEFGYSPGTAKGFWRFPPHWGFVLLALSPGKGMLVFNPLLWLAPLAFWLRRVRAAEYMLCFAVLLGPWLIAAPTTGWHASQCWADRYLTPGVVVLVALAAARLFELRRGGLLYAFAFVGLAIQLGGVVTTYHGYYDLGSKAWAARWTEPAAGEDLFQRAVVAPRLSPTFGHWLYAIESLRGRIRHARDPHDAAVDSQDDAAAFANVYGVVPQKDGKPVPARVAWVEDAGFRHLAIIGLPWRLASNWLWVLTALLLAWLAWASCRLRAGWRSEASPDSKVVG